MSQSLFEIPMHGPAGPKPGDSSNPSSLLSRRWQISDRYSRSSTSDTSSAGISYELNGTDNVQSSELTRLPSTCFRRVNDVGLPAILKSTVYTPSISSASTSGKVKKCHICSKPPSTAYSQPLQHCSFCKRAYHLECLNPPISLESQLEQSPWICSRCNKTRGTLANMIPQLPSSKRALSSSPNQTLHGSPQHYRSQKRLKNVATIDGHIHDPTVCPTCDPTPDPTHDPTDTDNLNLKLVSWLSKMSVKDPSLQKLLRKVGEGELSESELEEYNRYIAQAFTAIEACPQSPPKPTLVEDFLSSRRKAEESRSKQYKPAKPPVQPALVRQIAPVLPASIVPASHHLRSDSPLFMSLEPEIAAAKTMSSAHKSSHIRDAGVDPFIKPRQPSFNRSKICAEQTHTVHIEKSSDSVQAVTNAGEPTSNLSTNCMQSSASPPVSTTTSQQRFNTAVIGHVARSSSVIGHSPLSPSNRLAKQSPNDSSTSSTRHNKTRASSGQAGKGNAVRDAVEVEDEDANFFAKYEKKKPTNQDLARYRQGRELPLTQRTVAESIEDMSIGQGVEMEEDEPYGRRVLKEKPNLTGPSVDRMISTKFDTKGPSSEKPRSNVEQQKPSISSEELEKCRSKVHKLQEKISLKDRVIVEKNNTIDKLRGEVSLLKKTQRRSSELENDLTKATEHLDDAEAEACILKSQLKATQKDLENAQGLVLEQHGHYESLLKAREVTDAEIEAANLRDENTALKKAVASLRSQNDPFAGHHFAHKNLFSSPLVGLPMRIRAARSRAPAAPARRRGRPTRTIPEAASDEEKSEEGSMYREGTSSERGARQEDDDGAEGARGEDREYGEGSEEEMEMTRNQRGMMALDGWLAMPTNPKPVRLEGVLGYRDGTKDQRGRLPRAKKVYKVGRNVAGELR